MIDINTVQQNIKMLSSILPSFNIDSIFIEQNGMIDKLEYNKVDELHELRSCSKLLVAMAIGIAIDKGMITLETLIYPIIKNIVKIENQDNISKIERWNIKTLLTHTTGYEKMIMSAKEIKEKNINTDNIIEYALNVDIPYQAGTRFIYNNVEPFILSVFFQENFGVDLVDFINENIFEKLNIVNYKWDNYGKYCPGCTGLFLSHCDFHKIGQLLLNNGFYNNIQIISENWLNEMCKLQLETPSIYNLERVLPKIGIGYYLFISRDGYIFRDGSNGQYIIVNKDKNILITIMSSEKEMKNITEIFRNII